MIGLRRHPSWRELNRLADHELDADARGSALEHIAACPKCSRNVSLLNDLREAGRTMRHPSPPKDLLDDILGDRSKGLRIILPAVPPSPRPARRMLPAAAAVAIVASLAGLATLTLTSDAGAGASDLTVHPANPMPGEEVRLTYRPGVVLAGETELRLRLRLRGPDSEPPRDVLGRYEEVVLLPDRDGQYAGSFQLPPDFAYAAISVENLAGDRLDDRNGRLWRVRAHTEDGVPLPGALRQEFLVLQKRSWPEAEAVLQEMTLLYPESAEGWSMHLAYELPTQLQAEAAASLAYHREIFRGLQGRTDQVELSVRETAAMTRFAIALEDTEAFDHWVGRLESLDPTHRIVVNTRVAGLGTDRDEAGDYLEELWSVKEHRTPNVCRAGYGAGVATGDADLTREWALRCLPLVDDQGSMLDMVLTLVAHEETRERGIHEIRALLDHMAEGSDDDRPLHDTPNEVRRESRRLQATLRVRLGQQLLASDEPVSAILELDAADELGVWLPILYRTRLEATLSIGDQGAALSDFHRLDADPVYPRESVDSLRRLFPSLTRADLAEGRERAQSEMIQRMRVGRDAGRGLPPGSLLTSTGQPRSLESLLSGRPTILLMWDRRVFGTPDDVAEVIRAGHLLAGSPGQLLWVTPEPDSESLQSFTRGAGLGLPAYQDPGSELATALGEWGLREYFVIDRAGMIRARTHSLMEAVRHLEVLRLGSRDTA